MTWDGKQNREFWKKEGCGPSAVVALSSGDFLVTCYDSVSIARISADAKTLFLAESEASRVVQFKVQQDGSLMSDFYQFRSASGLTKRRSRRRGL